MVAYTVSLYRATQGSRKDQPTVPLNLSFAVVLHDEFQDSDDGELEDEQEDDPVEEDGYEGTNDQINQALQGQSAGDVEDQSAKEVEEENEIEVDN